MGRRSLTSTKGGKFMNPTDQARKEARKKELKKNKKQRMAVRQAVLKGKDPEQIIEDLIKIDEMEYNVSVPAPLSEKVLVDKRKKLLEIFDRVLNLYKKEGPEKYKELKAMQRDYDQRRMKLIAYYESVKTAEAVTPDEIPLPSTNDGVSLEEIPMPQFAPVPKSGILKKTPGSFFSDMQRSKGGDDSHKSAPGVPLGPPPDLSDCSSDEETPVPPKRATQLQANPAPKITNTKNMGMSRDKHLRFAASAPSTAKDEVLEFLQQLEKAHQKEPPHAAGAAMPPPSIPPPHPSKLIAPPAPPPGPMWNMPHEFMPPPMGMPPMGMPPRLHPAKNVIEGRPAVKSSQGKATIQAKPQMRSLQQEVVKFVPSQLRIRKDGVQQKSVVPRKEPERQNPAPGGSQEPKTKDDAYQQFLKEMQGLL